MVQTFYVHVIIYPIKLSLHGAAADLTASQQNKHCGFMMCVRSVAAAWYKAQYSSTAPFPCCCITHL